MRGGLPMTFYKRGWLKTSNMTPLQIEKTTADLLRSRDLYHLPVNIMALANGDGCQVFEKPMSKKSTGFISIDDENPQIFKGKPITRAIVVNSTEPTA